VEYVCEPGGVMILFYPGWRDYHPSLGDDLETVLLEQTGQERVQNKEPDAEPHELLRGGIIGTVMADTRWATIREPSLRWKK
jgi:hypothetical protein